MKTQFNKEVHQWIDKFQKYYNDKTNYNFDFRFIDLDNPQYDFAYNKIIDKEYKFYFEDVKNDLHTYIILIYLNNNYVGFFTLTIQDDVKDILKQIKADMFINLVTIVIEKKYRNNGLCSSILENAYEFSIINNNIFCVIQPKISLCQCIYCIYKKLRNKYTLDDMQKTFISSKHFDYYIVYGNYKFINNIEEYDKFVYHKSANKFNDTSVSLLAFSVGYDINVMNKNILCIENSIWATHCLLKNRKLFT